ncbi:MAG: hypothetical protein ACJAR2_003526, partial [Ilumatobacter sp.]
TDGTDRIADAGRNKKKFIATDTSNSVGWSHGLTEAASRGDEESVTRGMSENVVDILEAIKVKENRSHMARLISLLPNCLGQLPQELVSVGKPSQGVVRGAVYEFRHLLAGLGDVVEHDCHVTAVRVGVGCARCGAQEEGRSVRCPVVNLAVPDVLAGSEKLGRDMIEKRAQHALGRRTWRHLVR